MLSFYVCLAYESRVAASEICPTIVIRIIENR